MIIALRSLLLSLMATLAACAPDSPKPTAPAPSPATPTVLTMLATPAVQAHAFFKGQGEHWSISLEQAQDGSYPLNLHWDHGRQHAQGPLQRSTAEDGASTSVSVYEGQVKNGTETLPVKVEISLGSCTDRADNLLTHRVQVTLNDDDELSGCGGLL